MLEKNQKIEIIDLSKIKLKEETNFERAKRIIESWPQWKREYKLTKHSK